MWLADFCDVNSPTVLSSSYQHGITTLKSAEGVFHRSLQAHRSWCRPLDASKRQFLGSGITGPLFSQSGYIPWSLPEPQILSVCMVHFGDWFPESSRGSTQEREERERERAPGKKTKLVGKVGLSHTVTLVQLSFQQGGGFQTPASAVV